MYIVLTFVCDFFKAKLQSFSQKIKAITVQCTQLHLKYFYFYTNILILDLYEENIERNITQKLIK